MVLKDWNQNQSFFNKRFLLYVFAYLLTTMNPFLIILRYFLSMANITSFFNRYHVMHDISPACINVKGFEGQELLLVYVTSILIWLLLPSMLYMVSEVVCPAGGREYLRGNQISHILSEDQNELP